ncbi:MAG: nuclear transport factor 2 family protein [Acidobacteriota bacterium]
MHPNAELIERFYTAFAARDHREMAACYLPNATFSDPAFPHLEGERIAGMWRMLCLRGKDLELTFSNVSADDQKGSADWEAIYTFGATGRRVHNRIVASFEFEDGGIRRHVDRFDFYRWTRMALGPTGTLLGWSRLLQGKVRRQAAKQLDKFLAREAAQS